MLFPQVNLILQAMPSLHDIIAREAAQSLALSAGCHPGAELGRFRQFLKRESHRLKMMHRNGAGGIEICRARAALVDALLQYLLDGMRRHVEAEGVRWGRLAVVALGGYGRAELNPHSDIDIMFLHDGRSSISMHPALRLIGEGWLADIGLSVGHATRTIKECVAAAREDIQTQTAMLDARLVTGCKELFEQFQSMLMKRVFAGREDEYIAARLEDQAARHAKFGNSPLMQEPHIKNGCGGLRDYQNLLWMLRVKYKAATLDELDVRGLIEAGEVRQLSAAYDFLLRARTELHYQAGRAVDLLSKNFQPKVACGLGYKDRSPRARLEKFMRDYYTHARRLYLITRTVEERLALDAGRKKLLPAISRWFGRKARQPSEADGFRWTDGRLQAVNDGIFDESPARLMRAFLHAQQRGLELHPDLKVLIRGKLRLVTPEFRRDRRVRETFLAILNQRGNVAPVLRAMHDTGLLGKYIPEFGRLTNRVQHEFFHQYAADEHTLACIEMLDRVWDGRQQPYSNYTSLLQSLERPFILYLALLLHDTGKAVNHTDHALAGERIARRVARRLNLEQADAETLGFFVRHHLLMAQISQRRDLEDETVIRSFAGLVGNEENLKGLVLLTFADTLGTSEKLWNGFKDALLQTLYKLAAQMLKGGQEAQTQERQLERLRQETVRLLPADFPQDELQAHWEQMPARYFSVSSPADILEDLELVHRFMRQHIEGDAVSSLTPVIAWHDDPDRACTEIKICTWDRARLFSRLAGALSAAGINILSARIFTRADGIAIDSFSVTEAGAGNVVSRKSRGEFEAIVQKAMLRPDLDLYSLIAKSASRPPLYQRLEGESIPTRINFDNDSSENYTIIEVETEDRLGLLYVIADEFAMMALDIALAKICTEKGAALDAFYVRHRHGGKITDALFQERIRQRLQAAILSLDRQAGTPHPMS